MKTLKKPTTIFMAFILCAAVLTACANTPIKPLTAEPPTNTPADPPSVNPPVSNPDPQTTEQEEMEKRRAAAVKDLTFVYNGSTFTLSDPADDIKLESTLGKAEEIKTHTYSKDDGLNMDPLIGFTEKQYKFPGLVIKTIKAPSDTEFHIFSIRITDSKYPTSRNIKVGDSVKMLMEAYPEGNMLGNGAAGEEDDFQYMPVDYVNAMKVHVNDGKVESIMMNQLLD